MTSVNILQDFKDKDTAEEELRMEYITSLLGVGRLALQIITESSGINHLSMLLFYMPKPIILHLLHVPQQNVLAAEQ